MSSQVDTLIHLLNNLSNIKWKYSHAENCVWNVELVDWNQFIKDYFPTNLWSRFRIISNRITISGLYHGEIISFLENPTPDNMIMDDTIEPNQLAQFRDFLNNDSNVVKFFEPRDREIKFMLDDISKMHKYVDGILFERLIINGRTVTIPMDIFQLFYDQIFNNFPLVKPADLDQISFKLNSYISGVVHENGIYVGFHAPLSSLVNFKKYQPIYLPEPDSKDYPIVIETTKQILREATSELDVSAYMEINYRALHILNSRKVYKGLWDRFIGTPLKLHENLHNEIGNLRIILPSNVLTILNSCTLFENLNRVIVDYLHVPLLL